MKLEKSHKSVQTSTKQLSFRRDFIEGPLQLYDWIIFIFFAFCCFFIFQQGDILHTGGSAIAYLNGHIWDFYDYNKVYMVGNNYLPSTYILFAIWDIPLRLFGIVTIPTENVHYYVLMWYKLLPCLFYIACGYLMYKIGLEIGFGSKKAKLCAYAFLTTPIGFFSQFLFGQYDIFTVFFVLLGIYYYIKDDTFKFILFFSIAITFKYFAFFVFVPLLLLREKNIMKDIRNVVCVFIPLAAEVGFYFHSEAFHTGVFGFGATNYIFAAAIPITISEIRLVIVGFLLVCGWAAFTQAKDYADEIKWAVYFCNIIAFIFFGLSFWHPQWLLFAVPLWVLGTFMNKRSDIFFVLDLLAMFFYIGFTVNIWTGNVDQSLFSLGILKKFAGNIDATKYTMQKLFLIHDPGLWFSAFSSILLINAIFKHPKFCVEDFQESIDHFWGYVRARFVLGVSIFIVPAFACLILSNTMPIYVFNPDISEASVLGPITTERQVAQVFTASTDTLSEIDGYFATYSRTNDSKLKLTIQDMSNQKTLYSADVDVPDLQDNAYSEIKFSPINMTKGGQYKISFTASETNDNDYVTIYRTKENSDENTGYAIVDNSKQDYNLCIRIYGK